MLAPIAVVFLFGTAGLAATACAGVALGAAIEHRRRASLDRLSRLDPLAFERIVGAWLARGGWVVEHRGGPGDAGIDLVAFFGDRVVAVQCKRYHRRGLVSAAHLRDLYGASVALGATDAFLVTTGRVSGAALAWAAALPDREPRLALVSGEALAAVARRRRWDRPPTAA